MSTSYSPPSEVVCNWGILGCATIARKNCRSIEMSPNSRVLAIASRSRDKAENFRDVNRLQADVRIYEGYDALLADPDINAVYIPLPTTMHLEWVVKAAKAHKHVLIEKPVAVTVDEFYAMSEACRENNVLLMDGVMFMHHERLRTLNSFLKDPRCGEVARVESSFSFNGGKDFVGGGNIRTQAFGDPLGALGDLGWYCIRLGQVAFSRGLGDNLLHPQQELAQPSHCIATCDNWTPDGVPLECDVKVYFHLKSPDSFSASATGRSFGVLAFNASFLLPFRQSYQICIASDIANIQDQIIRCEDFVLPKSPYSSALNIEIGAELIDNHTCVRALHEDVKTGSCVQEANMFTTFSSLVSSSTVAEKLAWTKLSCQTQLVVSACFESMKRGGERVDIAALRQEYFE